MRSEVNVKVKVTQDGMHHSAIQDESTHQIPTSNNIGDMLQTQLF